LCVGADGNLSLKLSKIKKLLEGLEISATQKNFVLLAKELRANYSVKLLDQLDMEQYVELEDVIKN